jgi:hypothetical protein
MASNARPEPSYGLDLDSLNSTSTSNSTSNSIRFLKSVWWLFVRTSTEARSRRRHHPARPRTRPGLAASASCLPSCRRIDGLLLLLLGDDWPVGCRAHPVLDEPKLAIINATDELAGLAHHGGIDALDYVRMV